MESSQEKLQTAVDRTKPVPIWQDRSVLADAQRATSGVFTRQAETDRMAKALVEVAKILAREVNGPYYNQVQEIMELLTEQNR